MGKMNPILERRFQEIQELQDERSKLNEKLSLKVLGWGGGTALAGLAIASLFTGGAAAVGYAAIAPGMMAARMGTKGVTHAVTSHQSRVRTLDAEIKSKLKSIVSDLSKLLKDKSVSRDDGVAAYYNLKYMNLDMDDEIDNLKKELGL